MANNAALQTPLPAQDLDFIAQKVAPDFKDKKQLKQLIIEDPAFRKGLTANPELFKLLTGKNPLSLGVSPALFFEVLLRQTVKDLEASTHTVERSAYQRIPVFDANEVLELLKEDDIFYYLVRLLAAFVRCEQGTVEDIDIDRLVQLSKTADKTQHFLISKRIADICLFILGVFPEYLMRDYVFLFFRKKPPLSGELRRNLSDYETLGREFYSLASEQEDAKTDGSRDVLRALSANLVLAEKPLNHLSDRYLAITPHKNPGN